MANPDPLQRLRDFNRLLRETNAVVKEKTTAIESQDQELDALEETRLEQFNAALDDLEKGANDAQSAVVESLESLLGVAGEVRDQELAEAAREVERYESALEQQLDADDSALERAYGELSQAFDAVQAAAAEADAEYARVEQESGQAFAEVDTSLDEAEQRVDAAADAAVQAIEALAEALTADHAAELESEAETSIALWGGLPAALEGDCEGGAQAINALYETTKTRCVDSGAELMTATDAMDEALGAIEPAATELAAQVDALEEIVGGLRVEGESLEAVMRTGADMATELLPLLGELATAVSRAEEIRQALDAIEA
jgi:DNA repair exonuclease SbcCD ATPase subunit